MSRIVRIISFKFIVFSLFETDFIAYTLGFISISNLLSETCFSVNYLAKVLSSEYESNGPISAVIKRLFTAIEENDILYIKSVLSNCLETSCKLTIKEPAFLKFDVNIADENGLTALHLASVSNFTSFNCDKPTEYCF